MARLGQSSGNRRPPAQKASRAIGEAPPDRRRNRSGRPKAPSAMPLRRRWQAVGLGTLLSAGSQGLFFLSAWLIDANGSAIVNFLPLTGSLFLALTALEVIRRMTEAVWEGRNRTYAFVFLVGIWLLLPSNLGIYGLAVWPMLGFGVASIFAFGPGDRHNARARIFGMLAATVYVFTFFLTTPALGMVLGALFPFVTIALSDRFMERKVWAASLRG
ncbi:MAG TPA: hypothetical protein VLD62_09850 [Acidimicrobiia bacterium]|nr:hypothetical protein [Acidimicrobiia bacterium]